MNTQTQEVTGAVTTANALKMAIEFIEMHLTTNERTFIERTATLEACKEALEQPEQEPVAWTDEYKNFLEWDKESLCDKAVCKDHEAIPLYTHPAPAQEYLWDGQLDNAIIISKKKEWQGLSDDEIEDLCHKYWDSAKGYSIGDIIDMAEQALRNKNGY